MTGTWYSYTGTNSNSYGEYRYASLYTEGFFGEDLIKNLITAGFAYDEDYGDYVSGSGDVEVDVHEGANYTELGVYGPYTEPEWPEDDVAELVDSIVPGTETVVPSIEGTQYEVDDSWYNSIFVYSEDDITEDYIKILTTAGWTKLTDDKYLSPDKDVVVALYYSSYSEFLQIAIMVYDPDAFTWPAEDLADLLDAIVSGTETVLPALDGYEYDIWSETELDIYAAEDITDDYAEVLLKAGWTLIDDDTYLSPDEDIIVELYFDSYYGCLEVLFDAYEAPEPLAEWPTEEVAKINANATNDTLPAYTGTNNGFYFIDNSNGSAVVVLVDEGNEDDAKAAYMQILLDAGYTYDSDEECYFSENYEIVVRISDGAPGSFTIEFACIALLDAFPVDKINEFLEDYDLGFTFDDGTVFPGEQFYFEEDVYNFYGYEYHYANVYIMGDYFDEYTTLLEGIILDAGYEFYTSTFGDDYYSNDDYHEIYIVYDEDNDITIISFYE